MTERHTAIITRHFETLINNLTPDPILTKLVASGIFTIPEARKIRVQDTSEMKAVELLFLLLMKEDHAFYVFTRACKENCMTHLANLLLSEGN